jgi:hypothetical protein
MHVGGLRWLFRGIVRLSGLASPATRRPYAAGRVIACVAVACTIGLTTGTAEPAASACGNGKADSVEIGGRVVRVMLVVPADSSVEQAAVIARITAATMEVASWWRQQDPTREPRFESQPAPCGSTVRIRTLRLPDAEAVLEPFPGRAARISAAVVEAGNGSPYVKTLAYYPGRVSGPTCGQGDGELDGQAVGIVFLEACGGVPTETIAVHELLHALGAAPASHACGSSSAHVCDSANDVLFPVAHHVPLEELTLDVGRDDYYGHTGRWPDVRDSRWLRHVDDQVLLTTIVEGRGVVAGAISGSRCDASCQVSWDRGTFVPLTAVPAPGSRFLGWSGACSGTGQCNLDLRASTTLRATFVTALP